MIIVNMVLGTETTIACVVKHSQAETEITWSIGDQIFEQTTLTTGGALVLDSEVSILE